ncbi:IclR family transcriptional regulator [Microbaculum marinum]|uniref:IclR family transcriptional regulator n=1 Tax=Microbaculum marinum TaxID=1764581 RepID=A0AAW9RKI4_9HYPH
MVKSARRTLQLLELLSVLPSAVGVSEIARYLGVPKSSAQALLETLVDCGYAEREGAAYVLAGELRHGGWVGGEFAMLRRAARPVMVEVAEMTGESVFLGIRLPNWRIRYIDKVVSAKEVRYDGGLAHDRPAYCTSIGQLFLAAESAAGLDAYLRREPLEQITRDTQTDPEQLRRTLAQVRERGWAESRNGHVDGASGIAAPVRDSAGRPIAGLTIAAPTSRFDCSRKALIEATTRGAEEITRNLRARAASVDGEPSSPEPA